MRVNRQEVQRVALLARLELSDAETDELVAHFDTILAYMDKLSELDTDRVEPLAHAVDVKTGDPDRSTGKRGFPTLAGRLRDDQVATQADANAMLQNAPQRQADFLKVPKIIE